MALDFTTGVLDPRVSVVRALNTATRVNSSGLIEVVNANLPRFNHNPVTLAPRGLLIEELRTNLLVRSEEFETASWGKVNLSTTANTTTAPSGAVTADSIIENTAASAFHQTSQTFTSTAATTYSFSVFLKANGRDTATLLLGAGANFVFFAFNLSTATVGAVQYAGSTWSNGTASITNFGNGWYRCVISGLVSNAASYAAVVEINEGANRQYTGNGTSGLFVWGAQLEVGIIPTSYIPTVASQVTRNNDQVSMTGTNFSSWYNASEGTFLAVADASNANSANTTVYYASNVPATDIIYGVAGTIRSLRVITAGSTVAELNAGAFVNGVPSTVVGAYKVNDYLCAKDGGTVQADTLGAVPTGVSQLVFGSNSTFQTALYLNGHVAKFYYYPRRLTSAEVRAYSKFT
jgi:hypothetical protein